MRSEALTPNIWVLFSRFKPDDGSSMFLRNVGIYQQVHAALKPRTPTSTDYNTASLSQLRFIQLHRLIRSHAKGSRSLPQIIPTLVSLVWSDRRVKPKLARGMRYLGNSLCTYCWRYYERK
jgi:hypothetical protein